MIKKSQSPTPGHICITFELPASLWADQLFLTGDFNGWQPHDCPLHQERDGTWRTTLDLPADDIYEFRYLIDGQWRTDYHADGFASNGLGSHNSIVNAVLPIKHSLPKHRGTPLPTSATHARRDEQRATPLPHPAPPRQSPSLRPRTQAV